MGADYDLGSYEDIQDMRREARQERRVAEKTYLKCSAKARTFDNGGSVIKLGVKVDDLIAFAREHGNQGGYLNLVVSERREPGKYGDTHTVYLDDFVPRPRD